MTAYMTDLFAKFNETNLKLQGDQLNLIKTKSIISAFVAKLFLYKQNLGRGECSVSKSFKIAKCSMLHNFEITNFSNIQKFRNYNFI